MADDRSKNKQSDDEKLSRVFNILGDTLDRRQKEFRKRNWGTVTGIQSWKKWSLAGLWAFMLLQVIAVYANLPIANSAWFLIIFVIGCILATILIPVTFIRRGELKRETPQDTLCNLKEEATEDSTVSQQLHKAADPQTLKRSHTKIDSDLKLLEARKNFISDILKDIGPAFAALGAILKLMDISASINRLMATAILLFGAVTIIIRIVVLSLIQPHVMRRKKFLVILDQAEALEQVVTKK